MATIYIDGKPFEAKDGANLLDACLSLGFDVPYFCWHPALHSVGACRQCAVKVFKDETDTKGKIVMSCMTPVADGMRLSIDDPEAIKFRASVIEWLMLNHPHDCPVCDEGGECHLQDMTLLAGHVYRRTTLKKRTHTNQDLGPFVNHEMNRCIQCYRCVRFYKDYAGGKDLDVFGCHDHVYFGRSRSGALESEFSGNLVEVCPTGVFTDKTFKKHYTRKWDLQAAPSVCVHCSLGCNTLPGERYGTLRRIRNRYNQSVNGYFLCDRGRYGYEFVNGKNRIREVSIKTNGAASANEVKPELAISEIMQKINGANDAGIIGIGSPRASLESNYALRELVGAENFYYGISDTVYNMMDEIVRIIKDGPVAAASLEEARAADAVLMLGEDVSNTAPMLALALKQASKNAPKASLAKFKIPHWDNAAAKNAIQDEKSPFFIASFTGTRLDNLASSEKPYRAAPDDIARLGFLIAHELAPESPGAPGASEEEKSLASRIARALRNSKRPLIVCGTGPQSIHILRAAANAAWALKQAGLEAKIAFSLPACNSMGLALMDFPSGKPASEALKRVQAGGAKAVIVIENELDESIGKEGAEEIMSLPCSVAIDCIATRTSQLAAITLPAASFAEAQGTFVNNETRAQRFYKVMQPQNKNIQGAWRWIGEIKAALGNEKQCPGIDALTAELAKKMSQFAPIADRAYFPPPGFRIAGMKIPRQPHRYSGRTAMHTNIGMVEPKPPADIGSPLSFSMEGFYEASKKQKIPSALLTHYWAPSWNSVQALNKFQSEIGGPLLGGESGKRLMEPSGSAPVYFTDIPEKQKAPGPSGAKGKGLFAVPLYHVFGSERLSMESQAVASLCPEGGQPFIAASARTLSALGLNKGDTMELEIGGTAFGFKTVEDEKMAEGLAGVFVPENGNITADLAGLYSKLPAWARFLVKTERQQ